MHNILWCMHLIVYYALRSPLKKIIDISIIYVYIYADLMNIYLCRSYEIKLFSFVLTSIIFCYCDSHSLDVFHIFSAIFFLLTDNSVGIESTLLTNQGLPVVSLTSGRSFTYKIDLGCWSVSHFLSHFLSRTLLLQYFFFLLNHNHLWPNLSVYICFDCVQTT